jgi:ERCC4-type nuclease
MIRDWTIVQDTREKKPLLFPANIRVLDDKTLPTSRKTVLIRVHTVRETLGTGDYLLKGFEGCTMIERKGSLREIAQNCLTKRDRARFVKCLQRMRDAASDPVLLLEGTPLGMTRVTKHVPEPAAAVDALMRLLQEYGIRLFLLPTQTASHRRASGEWALRLLINGALHHGNP